MQTANRREPSRNFASGELLLQVTSHVIQGSAVIGRRSSKGFTKSSQRFKLISRQKNIKSSFASNNNLMKDKKSFREVSFSTLYSTGIAFISTNW
jgi:hypothetical protein